MGGGETYKPKAKHPQGTNSMKQHAHAKHPNMHRTDDDIVDEVSLCQGLKESGHARVSVDALSGIHVLTFFVDEHDIQGEDVDEHALDEGDDMDVPIELGSFV